MITHEQEEERLGKRIIRLADGLIVDELTLEE
jgi:ABC-type uncharacterized transport system ATPase component